MSTYNADEARAQVSPAMLEGFDEHVAEITARGDKLMSVIITSGVPIAYNIDGGAL